MRNRVLLFVFVLCAGVASAQTTPLGARTYSLIPRALGDNLEQVRAAAVAQVEVVRTMLYAQTGQAAATTQGRRLWYDPNTLQLTIVDYPENLLRVGDYLRGLDSPRRSAGRARSSIILLKHRTPDEIAELVNRVRPQSIAGE